ncbi:MAG: 16S rRNA (cytidine(1402)-2'-O)-methyltransferase [Methyloceanibacter sp.]
MQDRQRETPDASRRVLERAQGVLAEQMAQPLPPGLYLVATPIGNLADISLRALAVLSRADLIAAEDTRHSRKLLSHFGIKGELTPYHEHNAAKERPRLLARIGAGFSVALISDAGTPLVSDPGYKLVCEAVDAGLAVTSIPGPSAVMAGLTSASLPTDTFLFGGFLPPKAGARHKRLEELKAVPATLVFFETASRLAKSVADMAEVLGPREAALARELTKLHETVTRGNLTELAALIEPGTELKGEFVVVIGPPSPEDAFIGDDQIVAALKQALQDESFRDAVRSVAERFKLKRSRVYELGLALAREGRDEP